MTVPRPQIVQEYFDGEVKIDIYNHFRQGRKGVALEQRGTRYHAVGYLFLSNGFGHD